MNILKISLVLSVCLILATCGSSGPKQPQPGSPEFQWQVAKTAYKAGDYTKASEVLVTLSDTTGPIADQARPWALVMTLGMTNAYMELSDKYNEGSKRNRTNPGPFRRVASDYKTKAASVAMQFVEVSHKFTAGKKLPAAVFAFDLPPGGFEDPVQYGKISIGQIIQESEQLAVEKEVVKREMLRNACAALKTGKDIEKAKAAYQSGEAKVDPLAMMLMTAKGLYDVSEVFGPKKLDQPQRMKLVYAEALEALELVKDTKEAKELIKKISDQKKKYKMTS
jgi:hypothetical protein